MSITTDSAAPSFATTLVHSLAQKAASMAAAALLAAGLIPNNAVDQDTSLMTGAVLLLVSVVWTWVRSRIDTNRAKALAAAARK